MDSQLNIEDLHTYYDTPRGSVEAIEGIDLSIQDGETVGLVGESGSGKSVTARSILRLIESPGEIVSGGVNYRNKAAVEAFAEDYPSAVGEYLDPNEGVIDLTQTPESVMRDIRGGEISMIFQDPMTSLNPSETVGTQIAESLRLHRYDGKKRDTWLNAVRELLWKISGDRLDESIVEDTVAMLWEVGFPDPEAQLDKYPHEFSGGMRQRVLIAMALACQPNLLIADEPTTALDVTIQAQVLDIINDLKNDLGMSVLFITHDLGVVAEVCDQVAVMYAGNIVEEGPVDEIFDNPSHPYTYSLLESIPRQDKERLTPIDGNVPDLIDIGDGCHFADRCPWAQDKCTIGEIPYLQHGSAGVNHRSKCILEDFDEDRYQDTEAIERDSTHSTAESLVQVKSLRKYYSQADGMLDEWIGNHKQPVRAVDGVSLDIYEGETLGLVGESGCGKSTLGRSILKLEDLTDGRLVFAGDQFHDVDGSELREMRKDMQMIFQDPLSSLNPRMTIGEIISDPLRIHGLPESNSSKAARRERVVDLLEDVGLEARQYDRYPHEISGGQRQRVGIARALAVEPNFIVADEPVSSLDVSVQAQIINLLEDLQDKYGLTYLLIAHDLSVVRHIADRVAVMYLGEVVEVGETEDLFQDPKHPYTQALLSAVPTPDPSDDREDRIILKGDVPSPTSPPSGCSFHTRCPKVIPPDDVAISQPEYRRITEYRQLVESRNLDVETILEDSPATVSSGVTVERSAVEQALWEELFGQELTGEAGATIEESFELILNNDWSAAEELLQTEFESVCERHDPELDQDGHSAACHLAEDED